MTNQSQFASRFLVVTIAAAVVLAVPGLVAHAGHPNAMSGHTGHTGHTGFAIAQASGNSGGYPPLGFNPGNSNQTNQPNGAATWRSAPPPETMPLGPYAPIPQKHKAATGPDNETAGGTNALEGSGAATSATPMQASPSTNDAQMNLPPPGYPLPGMTQPMPPAAAGAAPAGTAGASAQDVPTAQQQMQYPHIQQPQHQYSGKPLMQGAPQVQPQPQQGQQWNQQAPGTTAGAPSAAPRPTPEQQQPAGYAQDGRQPQWSPQQGQQLNQQAYPPWSVPQYQQYKYWGQQWGQQPAGATAPLNAAQQQQGQPAQQQQPAQRQPQYVQPPPAYRPSMTPQQIAPVQQQIAPTQQQAAPATEIPVSPPAHAAAQPPQPAQPYPPSGQTAQYPEVQPQTHNWRGSQRPDYQPGANPHWWGGVR